MTQSLFVNEKEYLPSTLLSKEFGYTSDYISKLARDEKILATRIGRQWFIEPESLRIFSQQADISKRVRKESLSRERKMERFVKNTKSSTLSFDSSDKKNDFNALLQSAAVLACGFFVGGLSWVAFSSDLHRSDIALGASDVAAQIAGAVKVDLSFLKDSDLATSVNTAFLFETKDDAKDSLGIETRKENKSFFEGEIFTSLPQFSDYSDAELEVKVENSPYAEETLSIEKHFSDEVVVSEEEGSYVVQPVFKDSEGNRYEFSLVPVTDKSDFE